MMPPFKDTLEQSDNCWLLRNLSQILFTGLARPQFTAMNEPQCFYNESIAFFYNRSGKHLATEWNTVSKLVMGLGITLLRQGLIDTSLTASVANLLAIAIERHVTVFHMQLHIQMSNRQIVVVIVVIWTMAIVMGAIPSVGWNCICDIENCSKMAPLYSDSYLVLWVIFNLVTFVVMVVLYAHIFGCVRQRTMRMSQHSSGPWRNRDTMMSLLKTVVIVLGAFIICWTPGLALLLLDVCCPQCDMLAYEKFFLLVAEFNSAMNPIIYSYCDKEMSATFRQILCCQLQCELQWPHRRLRPLGFLPQTHHLGWSSQQ
ncbi:hypothetical protein H8959_002392 [Pygathrix nigripes]